MSLFWRVVEFMVRHRLAQRGETVVAAVSGGLDSVVLLDLLHRAAPVLGFRLVVGTVDHGIRRESASEVRFVRELASARGLPCYCGRVFLGAGNGLEDAARRERLAFLMGIPGDRVALAHHQDDQAETVLLRLVRGAGLAGMGAMRPSRGPFIRPLLTEPRHLVRAWAMDVGLTWMEDGSNETMDRERNLLRGQIMPQLDRVHGDLASRLADLAAEAEATDAFLRDRARLTLQEIRSEGGVSRDGLEAAEVALRPRILQEYLRESGMGSAGVGRAHLGAMERLLLEGQPGRYVELPWGWRFGVSARHGWALPPPPAERPLGRGLTFLWGVYRVLAERPPGPADGAPLLLRPPRPGERVRGRPLVEVLRAAGIPAPLRPYHPVIEGPGARIWVPPGPPSCPPEGPVTARVTLWRHGSCPGPPWCATL